MVDLDGMELEEEMAHKDQEDTWAHKDQKGIEGHQEADQVVWIEQ